MIIAQHSLPQASWVRQMVHEEKFVGDRRGCDAVALTHEEFPDSFGACPQRVDP
jgi:hypothetical protein